MMKEQQQQQQPTVFGNVIKHLRLQLCPNQQADLCLLAPPAPFFFLITCRCEKETSCLSNSTLSTFFTATAASDQDLQKLHMRPNWAFCCHRKIGIPVYVGGIPSDTEYLKETFISPSSTTGFFLSVKQAQRSSKSAAVGQHTVGLY